MVRLSQSPWRGSVAFERRQVEGMFPCAERIVSVLANVGGYLPQGKVVFLHYKAKGMCGMWYSGILFFFCQLRLRGAELRRSAHHLAIAQIPFSQKRIGRPRSWSPDTISASESHLFSPRLSRTRIIWWILRVFHHVLLFYWGYTSVYVRCGRNFFRPQRLTAYCFLKVGNAPLSS